VGKQKREGGNRLRGKKPKKNLIRTDLYSIQSKLRERPIVDGKKKEEEKHSTLPSILSASNINIKFERTVLKRGGGCTGKYPLRRLKKNTKHKSGDAQLRARGKGALSGE